MSKVFIVEDDPMLVEIYEKKMMDAGFEVKVCSNGMAVKDEMLAWKPDLVLLDVVLPDMDGFEILEVIKKEEDIKNIPVYVFSNLSAREDIERATGLGAAGFLTKSNFTPSQLAEEIKKILGHEAVASPSPEPVSEVPEAAPEAKAESNGHKVLIIEDEDVFIEMFGAKLKQEGFEVVAAKNGKWGLKEAEKGGFDCILLDMMMPAMNGFEAIQELRANENTKDIPIIILSNSALDSEVQKALSLGANAYHIKTQVTPGEVAEEVKELVKI
ncbi:MAG: response regulator [Candidatus Moranbacteria bacterium]|nr:response regulator [Candidatus Moranbacteria bacterium]